eukprot:NODE_779_length_4292_cov_0.220606.p2 type:complete len:229 gc:universal NODE_779_length_4292_cov_0.220606:592-1278(+)
MSQMFYLKQSKMVLSCLICRVGDALPLAASIDDDRTENDLNPIKQQAKKLFKVLNSNSEQQCSVQMKDYIFHYIIDNGICFLTISRKQFPRQSAFDFLIAVKIEFFQQFGINEPLQQMRPYPYLSFETNIHRLKKEYSDVRQLPFHQLNQELTDVHQIMNKNLEDMLLRGENLEQMSSLSDQLKDSSLKYRKDANYLNLLLKYRKYGPPAIAVLLFGAIWYLRSWFTT